MLTELRGYDPENLFTVIKDSWQQCENGWNREFSLSVDPSEISDIIITGLGGSAISGDLLKNFLGRELKKNLTINRTYSLPESADENTLLIASTYSGNTEETVSVLREGIERGCPVIVLTTGGEAGKIASEHNLDIVPLQKGFQPRYALYNSFFTLLRIMKALGFTAFSDSDADNLIQMIKKSGDECSAESGLAYKTAMEIKDTLPLIYTASGFNESAGRRFKGQLNENSKMHAWCAEYPEMNHNEIVGWETADTTGINYMIVNLIDKEMHPRVTRRFDIINKLLRKNNIGIINIEGRSATFRERLVETVYLCDWISYYLALFNGKNPGEIDYIHHLKEKMAEG
ncbi:MAG TPA: bifunctional phosphoglucose/phosphomannose isomerase [Spirochaetota bacterium]|nr:bifunctional phosphoglucose/phosphomannose isomerase [Spirochaetota bacterium]HPJ35997.1 bifunctional phosphoglucose/phosphomannose isomerase [Spirochaetota bacterium]